MTQSPGLKPHHFFTISVGASIGVGWIPLYGIWLASAGSLGVALAFFFGTALMLFIVNAYVTVAKTIPKSGGETIYAYTILGRTPGFFTGWLLTFTYLAVCIFEAIAVAMFAKELVPAISGPTLYTAFGKEVSVGAVIISIAGTLLIASLHLRGVELAALFQDILTYSLLAISAAFVVLGLITGIPANLDPYFVFNEIGWPYSGLLSVFAAAPLLIAGFNFAVQVIGERSEAVPIKAVIRSLFLSILVVGLFYVGLFTAAAMSLPRETLLAADLPVAAAFSEVFGSEVFGRGIFFIAMLGLLTTWNGVLLGLLRILAVLAERGDLPSHLAEKSGERGVYRHSIWFVSLVTLIGAFGGEGMLTPIVGSASITITAAFTVVTFCALAISKDEGAFGKLSLFLASLTAIAFVLIAVSEPFVSRPEIHLPVTWLGLLVWIGLGIVLWTARKLRTETKAA